MILPVREVTVSKNDSGQRLDKFLTKFMPNLPPSMMYKGLRKNCVKINGKHIKDGAVKLCCGDVLSLYFKDEFFEKTTDKAFMSIVPDLNIVYEDENIILADKRPGMVVHEDESGRAGTLIDHIKSYLYRKGEYDPENEQSFVPSLCNRIDRNTGGIVIAAKNAEALRIMNQKIKDREMTKLYLCAVSGILDKKRGELKSYMKKDENKKQVYVYSSPVAGARTAVTRYRVIAECDNMSLVEADLITGRTHQIRAHFASIGHPLMGDGKYGSNKINKNTPFSYQALYSYKLKFEFTTDSGILSYLNGREFCADNVWFEKFFKGAKRYD